MLMACMLVLLPGCYIRRGFTWRCDWSFQTRRAPHRCGRGSLCHDGCPVNRACPDHEVDLGDQKVIRERRPAPPPPVEIGPSRFHPVPTHPVFSPSGAPSMLSPLPESSIEEIEEIGEPDSTPIDEPPDEVVPPPVNRERAEVQSVHTTQIEVSPSDSSEGWYSPREASFRVRNPKNTLRR